MLVCIILLMGLILHLDFKFLLSAHVLLKADFALMGLPQALKHLGREVEYFLICQKWMVQCFHAVLHSVDYLF